jgi:hypothetical protein
VSRAERVTTSSPKLTKGSKGSHEIDHVYGKNLSYLDKERYVLGVVQRGTPQRLEHAIVKWDVESGSSVMDLVLECGQDSGVLCSDLKLMVLNKGTMVAVQYLVNSTGRRSPPAPSFVKVFSVEQPTEGVEVHSISRNDWDFHACGLTRTDDLIFVSKNYLTSWNPQRPGSNLALIGSSSGRDIIALAVSDNRLTRVYKDGHLEVLRSDEDTTEDTMEETTEEITEETTEDVTTRHLSNLSMSLLTLDFAQDEAQEVRPVGEVQGNHDS